MRAAFPMRLGHGSINARAVLTKRAVQIADVRLDPEYAAEAPVPQRRLAQRCCRADAARGRVIGTISRQSRPSPGFSPRSRSRC